MEHKEKTFWFEFEDMNEEEAELFVHFEVELQTGGFTFSIYKDESRKCDIWNLVKSLNPEIYKDIEKEVSKKAEALRCEAA